MAALHRDALVVDLHNDLLTKLVHSRYDIAKRHGHAALYNPLRLDLDLSTASGKPLGLLARLRDLLPGRYAFGLTGRGPGGHILPPGRYRLLLVAYPTAGGPPSTAAVAFSISKGRGG